MPARGSKWNGLRKGVRVATVAWEHYPRVAAHSAARAFIESLAKRQRAPKTIDAYARNLEDLLRNWPGAPERLVEATLRTSIPTWSPLPRARMGPGDQDGSATHRPLSNATIQQRLVTTRLFFDFCLQRHLRQDPINPVPRGS